MKKYYLITAVLLLVAAWLVFSASPGNLEVYFFDVGQGDAILIKTPSGGTVLIDGGPDRKILRHLGSALPFSKRTIDLMILSHPHADHVTGLVGVLERYKIRQVMATRVLHTTQEYLEWLRQITEQKIPWQTAVAGQTITFPKGVKLEVLWPQNNVEDIKVHDLNTSSIAVRLVFGETAALFTGDITVENESEILASGLPVSAQLLKVPHQGSNTSSSSDFIQSVAPSWAIISVGKNNRFGHPYGEIIARYESMDVKVLRTDQQGTIRFKSDGKEWQFLKRWGLLNF
ncbi:MAG: ComEC/Rec2 family competence protein [Patescibacteria group bacterium]